MDIREAKEEEFDELTNLWLDSSLEAHSFISADYWLENKEVIKGLYFPLSENLIILANGRVKGFVSMMGNYLSALFLFPDSQGLGYGRKLIEYVKRDRKIIQLKVYEKNEQACRFYERNGFKFKEKTIDEATDEKEWLMEWEKEKNKKMEER